MQACDNVTSKQQKRPKLHSKETTYLETRVTISRRSPSAWRRNWWCATRSTSAAHKSPENQAFLKNFASTNPNGGRPNFMAVAAYDGMAAIYEVARKLNGKVDGDQAMAALKGMKLNSPRGPITIDPQSRDIVQTVYVRKVEKVGGEPYNVEFDQFAEMKDTGK